MAENKLGVLSGNKGGGESSSFFTFQGWEGLRVHFKTCYFWDSISW